jgi:hypothetical protein
MGIQHLRDIRWEQGYGTGDDSEELQGRENGGWFQAVAGQ